MDQVDVLHKFSCASSKERVRKSLLVRILTSQERHKIVPRLHTTGNVLNLLEVEGLNDEQAEEFLSEDLTARIGCRLRH